MQNPAHQRKIAGIGEAGWVVGQQWIDEGFFATETGEQGEISITGQARLSPSLDGQPTNKTERPAALIAE
ncbi:MAG: hypothetical protein SH847_08515 [Roseiflexaceae bacterium]|nr:hypothetical protein [Roseiflexaceae bacterium]